MDANGVRELLKIRSEAFPTHAAFAAHAGIGIDHLSQVINGRAKPGPKVLKFLNLRRVFAYEHVGITKGLK